MQRLPLITLCFIATQGKYDAFHVVIVTNVKEFFNKPEEFE